MQTREDNQYTIFGHIGSPYSIKMRAIMRYRRIPHVWKDGRVGIDTAKANVKVPVIPVFKYPDGTFHNDSTPLIYDLEERHPNGRSIIPGFLNRGPGRRAVVQGHVSLSLVR